MDAAKFELTMKKFFEKAGVALLKRSTDYKNAENYPSFVLLDNKRKTIYLTETDIPDETDIENNAAAAQVSPDLSLELASAVMRLGSAIKETELNPLALNNHDTNGLVKKSALIISEENSAVMTAFLDSKSIKYQTVPLKGAFLVYFIDEKNSPKIKAIAETASEMMLTTNFDDIADDESLSVKEALGFPTEGTAPEIEPAEEVGVEESDLSDIISSASEMGQKTKEEDKVSTAEEAESLLANIDLSEFVPQKLPEDNNTPEQNDLLYAKLLNDSIENKINMSELRKSDVNDIPKEIIAESDDIDTNEEENEAGYQPESSANPENNRALKSKQRLFNMIIANIFGVVIFTPLYIFKKLTSRFFPPFVIYWLSAVAAIFGFYQFIWPFAGSSLYSYGLAIGESASNSLITLLNTAVFIDSPIGKAASDMALSSGIYYSGIIAGVNFIQEGFILRYLMTVSGVLMIAPFSRKLGIRLNIFFFLFYFIAPLILKVQAVLFAAIVPSAAQNTPITISMQESSALWATAVILPILILIILYIISGWFIPNKKYEVIP